jgi:hypothetical protein
MITVDYLDGILRSLNRDGFMNDPVIQKLVAIAMHPNFRKAMDTYLEDRYREEDRLKAMASVMMGGGGTA